MDEWKPGLEGVVAARTALTNIDGAKGQLMLRGHDVTELAPRASFEEVTHLLLFGSMPDASELRDLQAQLARLRHLPDRVRSVLADAATRRVAPLEALRLAIESVDLTEEDTALHLVAVTPSIVATYARLLQGDPVVEVESDGLAAHFLGILCGAPADPREARALETYLNTMVDHGLNASTFTARVIVSTRSDLRSAVVGALGALKGPLHGGAPQPVLEMLRTLQEHEDVEACLREILDRGDRIMGFGHREYRARDPRAQVLADAAATLVEEGEDSISNLATKVEQVATRLLDEYKPGRSLRTNAEFYTAILLDRIGITPELFTPTFAISRTVGWLAHAVEQQQVDRIFRPTSEYVGEMGRALTTA